MSTIKAITISQPFASLIASGDKWIENRTWPTKYRGPIAIHAGKGLQYLNRDEIKDYPTGCVIAIAKLVACYSLDEILRNDANSSIRKSRIDKSIWNWSEAARHKHAEGPFCWILQDIKAIDPVPCRGAQCLWNWSSDGPR
jgi:hypothetical protein